MENQKFGMVFDTTAGHYFYDSGTGKVISCSSNEKNFIDKILCNKMSLAEACARNKEFGDFIKQENLFVDIRNWSFTVPTREEFEEQVRGKCEQVVLELTEACNLRCGYCIYNDHHQNHRKFSNKNMSFGIAKKSIDYLLKDYSGDEFALTFYGGEPLVNFDLMRQCIDYVRDEYSYINLTYGFTTNLTLLTKEMVAYLKSIEDIDIVCSIDGPKAFHDKYRRDTNGEGSFESAVKNFKILLDEFYDLDKKRTLSINCVLTPPYTKEKLEKVKDFFYNEIQLPRDIDCNYSYVDMGDMVFDYEKNEEIGGDNRLLEVSPLEECAANDFVIKKGDSEYFNLISTELARVANRLRVKDGTMDYAPLHGNCMPGQRRVYVTVDGEFKPCEKVGRAPALGNYLKGYDLDRIYKLYVEDYVDHFEGMCKNCWARLMCGACYESTMDGSGESPYVAGGLCDTSRQLTKDMLVNYYSLFEADRDLLAEEVSKIEFR